MISTNALTTLAAIAGIAVAGVLIYDHFVKTVPIYSTPYDLDYAIDTRYNQTGQGTIWGTADNIINNLPDIIGAF